jgi:hypothetical protein
MMAYSLRIKEKYDVQRTIFAQNPRFDSLTRSLKPGRHGFIAVVVSQALGREPHFRWRIKTLVSLSQASPGECETHVYVETDLPSSVAQSLPLTWPKHRTRSPSFIVAKTCLLRWNRLPEHSDVEESSSEIEASYALTEPHPRELHIYPGIELLWAMAHECPLKLKHRKPSPSLALVICVLTVGVESLCSLAQQLPLESNLKHRTHSPSHRRKLHIHVGIEFLCLAHQFSLNVKHRTY